MALNNFKCNHLMPLHFKGLNDDSLNWLGCVVDAWMAMQF